MTLRPQFWSTKLLAILTTLALAGISVFYWQNEKQEIVSRQQQVFLQTSEQLMLGIAHQLAHTEALINSVQGFHFGSNSLQPAAIERYVQTLQKNDSHPAVEHVSLLTRGDLARAPEREALQRSTDTGEITLSTALGDAAGSPGARSYVVVGPLYTPGAPLQSEAQRRAALEGWVRVLLRAQDMMEYVEQGLPPDLGVAIFDASGVLLYSNVPGTAPPWTDTPAAGSAEQALTRQVQLGGAAWTVLTYPLPAMLERLDSDEPRWILWIGLVTSLLVGTSAWLLGDSRGHALAQAHAASRSLQETNSALQGILNAMPDLMFALDQDGRYLEYWSPRQELLAAPPAQFIGKLLQDVLPPDAAAVCHAVIADCVADGHASGHQLMLTIQGQTKWFELSASRTQSAQGLPRFIFLSRDITQRKQVEQDLREHEQQLTLALKGGDMGFWDWDVSSGSMRANERWFTMLGLEPQSTPLGMDLWNSLVHPADQHKLETLVREVIYNPVGYEFTTEIRARHANGSTVWIQDKGAVFARDADGKPLRVVGTHMDITARKRDEERLRLSEYAFKSITQGIIITNLEGDIQVVNDAFCSISGYTREEVLGHNCRFLQGPLTDPLTLQKIRDSLRTLSHFSDEILNYRKDGVPFWNDLAIAPVFNALNEPSHFVGISKDITEKKLAEHTIQADREAIRSSQAQLRVLSHRVLEAQETERRRVAHELHDELGQSLTAIKINLLSQQARSGIAATAIDLENVRIVEDTLQQVRRLALALRPSLLDDLGLAPALTWLAKSASINRDMAVRFQHSMDRSRLPHDVETACFRIVQESLTNARRHAHASQVDIQLDVQAHQLRLTVTDNGAGFETPESALALSGTSLGLLGMRERAAAIGGSITIATSPGQGSTIELVCVLHEPETTPT